MSRVTKLQKYNEEKCHELDIFELEMSRTWH